MPPRRSLLVLIVTASALLAGCTGGAPEDTSASDVDEDGLPDAQENAGWGVTVMRSTGRVAYEVTSDPRTTDADGDGVGDAEEYRLFTDPNEPDTDFDGLLDGGSVCNPGPGAPDFAALGILTDPQNPACFLGEQEPCSDRGGLSPTNWDSDKPVGDGLGDGDEVRGWTITVRGEQRHVRTSPCLPDSDGDGISDGDEYRAGTDPRRADTDGDGAPDAVDADPLWNVLARATLVSATARDAPANGTLAVALNVNGDERRFTAPAPDGITEDATRTVTRDVDDVTANVSSLLATVILRVTVQAEDGDVSFVDVGGHLDGGALARVEHDLVRNLTRVGPDGEWTGGNRVTLSGDGGSVVLEINVGRE